MLRCSRFLPTALQRIADHIRCLQLRLKRFEGGSSRTILGLRWNMFKWFFILLVTWRHGTRCLIWYLLDKTVSQHGLIFLAHYVMPAVFLKPRLLCEMLNLFKGWQGKRTKLTIGWLLSGNFWDASQTLIYFDLIFTCLLLIFVFLNLIRLFHRKNLFGLCFSGSVASPPLLPLPNGPSQYLSLVFVCDFLSVRLSEFDRVQYLGRYCDSIL